MASIISGEENFYKALKNGHIHGDGDEIDFEVTISSSIVNWNYRIIENLIFNKPVSINQVDIKHGLIFKHCEFKLGLVFNEVTSSDDQHTNNPYNCSVLISKCKGQHIFLGYKNKLQRSFIIDSNSEFDRVSVNTAVIERGFKIKDSTINNILDITRGDFELELRNTTIDGNLRVETLKGDISILRCKIKEWSKFWNVECPTSFTFNDNVFNGTFNIEASRIKGLFIHRDVFNKKFELENRDLHGANKANCDQIFITEAKFIEGADFNGLCLPIEKITLRLSPSFEGIVNFDNWKVDDLQVSGINQNLKLLFKRMVFRFVLFNNFTNYSDLSFDKCSATSNSPLNLSNSDFGSARFNEFDLASFDVIRIDNISLDRIKASNVKWFDNNKLEIVSNVSEQDKQRGIREISRQLKHALSSSGNQIDSLLFKAREMEAYRNELKSSGKDYKPSDKIIMTVSQTNNFGLSWWKPTWIIFLITIGFYLVMLPIFSTKINYTLASSWQDVSSTLSEWFNNLDVFWQLFNPVRKFSSTYGEIDSGWLQFLDLFHRIILGVFIYQIIRGFRKLTNK
ncbi:hypothetical protein [Flavivirga rizhaonensis]|uniref:Uncharacterized protein n=1 Tax=Flavivirga rizhaonensis TaxID=2559571 RepID=A0A4S1DZE5_9FLAO|nr:hypothetical protein [Flavivirga rizhaonensis]TGV03395.1 hypothetical protein EM932_06900 [Flavivirga rizhaonensis]